MGKKSKNINKKNKKNKSSANNKKSESKTPQPQPQPQPEPEPERKTYPIYHAPSNSLKKKHPVIKPKEPTPYATTKLTEGSIEKLASSDIIDNDPDFLPIVVQVLNCVIIMCQSTTASSDIEFTYELTLSDGKHFIRDVYSAKKFLGRNGKIRIHDCCIGKRNDGEKCVILRDVGSVHDFGDGGDKIGDPVEIKYSPSTTSPPTPPSSKIATMTTSTTTTKVEEDEDISFTIKYELEVAKLLEKRKERIDNNNNMYFEDSFFTRSIKTSKSGISFQLMILPEGNNEYRRNHGWASLYLLCKGSIQNRKQTIIVNATGYIRIHRYHRNCDDGGIETTTEDIPFTSTFEDIGDFWPITKFIQSDDIVRHCLNKYRKWIIDVHFDCLEVTTTTRTTTPLAIMT